MARRFYKPIALIVAALLCIAAGFTVSAAEPMPTVDFGNTEGIGFAPDNSSAGMVDGNRTLGIFMEDPYLGLLTGSTATIEISGDMLFEGRKSLCMYSGIAYNDREIVLKFGAEGLTVRKIVFWYYLPSSSVTVNRDMIFYGFFGDEWSDSTTTQVIHSTPLYDQWLKVELMVQGANAKNILQIALRFTGMTAVSHREMVYISQLELYDASNKLMPTMFKTLPEGMVSSVPSFSIEPPLSMLSVPDPVSVSIYAGAEAVAFSVPESVACQLTIAPDAILTAVCAEAVPMTVTGPEIIVYVFVLELYDQLAVLGTLVSLRSMVFKLLANGTMD